MIKLKYVRPTKKYEKQAIAYINEFISLNSRINGVGGLKRYLDRYDEWLLKLEQDRIQLLDEENVPTETFFLIRKSDDYIIGMVNIRLALNEKLKKYGGHIGYSIRPTERQKGYNKINLYLALLVCQQHGIKEVLIDCDKENPGSAKTIQALGGVLMKEYYHDLASCIIQDYIIDVDQAIEENKQTYEPFI